MANEITLKSTVVYLTEEVAEGTAVDPSAGTEAVGILADGFEMNGEKELVERTLLRAGIQRQAPRTGIKTCSASLAVEASANAVAGTEPDYDLLMHSLLGGRRQNTTEVTSETGNTTTVLNIGDADISKFSVGDIVLVKEAGAFHMSPVAEVDSTVAAANITLLIAAGASFSDNVVIEKFTTYYGANTGHKNITLTSFMEDAYKLQAAGCLVGSGSLEGFEVGQLPSFNFSLTGQSYEETTAASGLTASTTDAAPPIVLSACVWKDGTLLPVRSVGLSVENTLGRVTSTCSPNGIISQRVTERAISGSLTPYMDSTSTTLFDNFDNNDEFSLFLTAYNPTGTAGEYEQAWGIFVPKAIITALPKSENDGIMSYDLEFQAGEDSSGTYSSDIYISFS